MRVRRNHGSPVSARCGESESAGTAPAPESEALTVLPPEGAEHPALRSSEWATASRTCMAVSHRRRRDLLAMSYAGTKPTARRKSFPLSWVRSAKGEGWAFKAWPEGRPLYNLDKIVANPQAPIIICEGEKAADAAGKLYAHAFQRASSRRLPPVAPGPPEKRTGRPWRGAS